MKARKISGKEQKNKGRQERLEVKSRRVMKARKISSKEQESNEGKRD